MHLPQAAASCKRTARRRWNDASVDPADPVNLLGPYEAPVVRTELQHDHETRTMPPLDAQIGLVSLGPLCLDATA